MDTFIKKGMKVIWRIASAGNTSKVETYAAIVVSDIQIVAKPNGAIEPCVTILTHGRSRYIAVNVNQCLPILPPSTTIMFTEEELLDLKRLFLSDALYVSPDNICYTKAYERGIINLDGRFIAGLEFESCKPQTLNPPPKKP